MVLDLWSKPFFPSRAKMTFLLAQIVPELKPTWLRVTGMWVMHPEQIPLRCHLNFHSSCWERSSCECKRRTYSIQDVSFKCTQHGSAQINMVKWNVFLVFCIVYPSWNRSDEVKHFQEKLKEIEHCLITADTVFWCYVRWRKVMANKHTYLNPNISLCYCMTSGQWGTAVDVPQAEVKCFVMCFFAQRKVKLLSTSFKALKHEHFEREDCYINFGWIFSTEILCSNSIKNAATDQLELGVSGQCWVQAM